MCVAFISVAAAAAGENPVNETTRHRTVDKPYNCRASGWNGIYLLAKLNGGGWPWGWLSRRQQRYCCWQSQIHRYEWINVPCGQPPSRFSFIKQRIPIEHPGLAEQTLARGGGKGRKWRQIRVAQI